MNADDLNASMSKYSEAVHGFNKIWFETLTKEQQEKLQPALTKMLVAFDELRKIQYTSTPEME